MFVFTVFMRALLPEILATDTFIWLSDTFTKDTLVLLKRTLVVFERCVPLMTIVSLALAKDVLNDVIIG